MDRLKAIKKIIRLCEVTAYEVTGQEVTINLDDNFAVLCPMEDTGDSPIMSVDIIGAQKKTMKKRMKIERKMYSNLTTQHNYSYFTSAFFHELGHVMTLNMFTDAAVTRFLVNFEYEDGTDQEAYMRLPHEVAADMWSLQTFMPNNIEYVTEFDRKVKKLLKKIY